MDGFSGLFLLFSWNQLDPIVCSIFNSMILLRPSGEPSSARKILLASYTMCADSIGSLVSWGEGTVILVPNFVLNLEEDPTMKLQNKPQVFIIRVKDFGVKTNSHYRILKLKWQIALLWPWFRMLSNTTVKCVYRGWTSFVAELYHNFLNTWQNKAPPWL